MRVFKKDIFIGSKVKYELNNDTKKASKALKPIRIDSNVLFIKTDEDTYIDLYEFAFCTLPKSLAKKFVTQYKTSPTKSGDICVYNLTPYFNNKKYDENDRIDLKDIIYNTKSL